MRTRLFSGAVLVTSSLFVVACSYDFDKFTPLEATGSSTNGSGGAAAGASGSSMSSGSGAGGAAGASSGGTAGSAGSEGTDAAVDSSAMKEGGADSDAGMIDVRPDIAADAPASSDAADVNPGEPDASPDTTTADAPAEAVADAPVDTGSCISSAECSCESFNGHAYRFCTTLRSWVDSESQCAQSGMRLARVDDAVENGFIRTTADAHGMAEIWIGIQDPTMTLHWQWPDGTQFWSGGAAGTAVGGLYNNWSANKPTGNSVRSCGSMLGSASAGGWQDRSCTSLLAYVCELY